MQPDTLPPPITGASVWTGPSISEKAWRIELTQAHIAEIDAALASSAFDAARSVFPRAPKEFPLPTLGALLLKLLQQLLHGHGFALLSGLPVERYDPVQRAHLFLGIGAWLGHARSQNAKGHLLGHVRDLGLSSTDPNVRIYQTHERQGFHTDSCDVVALLCLQEAQQGGDSMLVSAAALYNAMHAQRPDLLARLLRPMAHDRRGEVPPGELPYFMIPVFSWHHGQLTVFHQRQYFESAQRFPDAPRFTAADREALDLLDQLANDPAFHLSMRLKPGDMQFVHNHALLHDRTAFQDHPDPTQRRHLLRLWLACPGARELPPAFAARYGTLTVGDRGGVVVPGMQPCVPLEAV